MNLLPLTLRRGGDRPYAAHFLRGDRRTGRLATALLTGGALAPTLRSE